MQTHHDIVRKVSLKYPTSEPIYEISNESLISLIVSRLGEEALNLTTEDIQLAIAEARCALEHFLNEKEYLEIAVDSWMILRNL